MLLVLFICMLLLGFVLGCLPLGPGLTNLKVGASPPSMEHTKSFLFFGFGATVNYAQSLILTLSSGSIPDGDRVVK